MKLNLSPHSGGERINKKTMSEYTLKLGTYKNEQEKNIDWEQRRYEIAKEAMCALICAPVIPDVDPNPSLESISMRACALADTLIQRLKEEQQ